MQYFLQKFKPVLFIFEKLSNKEILIIPEKRTKKYIVYDHREDVTNCLITYWGDPGPI